MKVSVALASLLLVAGCTASRSEQREEGPVVPAPAPTAAASVDSLASPEPVAQPVTEPAAIPSVLPTPAETVAPVLRKVPAPVKKPAARKTRVKK
ncbi:MAG: hypothetical protein VKP72_13615 [bacterium]|nr:hypothetical protein [bacterium]